MMKVFFQLVTFTMTGTLMISWFDVFFFFVFSKKETFNNQEVLDFNILPNQKSFFLEKFKRSLRFNRLELPKPISLRNKDLNGDLESTSEGVELV